MKATIGAHLPIAGGIDSSIDRADELGFKTFQIFTRSPRGWGYPPINGADEFKGKRGGRIVSMNSHMPYLPNMASPRDDVFEKSIASLSEEIRRAEQLQLDFIVAHVGSHLGKGIDYGKRRVVTCLRKALGSMTGGMMVLLENMAGQANSVGSRFEDIGWIINEVGDERVGLVLDTCHAYAAGYDLALEKGLLSMIEDIDRFIGLKRFRLIHLNDSMKGLGSGLDRHARIGRGFIGRKGFGVFLNNEIIQQRPMILETPVSDYHEYIDEKRTAEELVLK